MRVKIARLFFDEETIELPETCPECDGTVNDRNTKKYYYSEVGQEGIAKFELDHDEPRTLDYLVMVSCNNGDCSEILADAGDPEDPEFYDRIRELRNDISVFLQEAP